MRKLDLAALRKAYDGGERRLSLPPSSAARRARPLRSSRTTFVAPLSFFVVLVLAGPHAGLLPHALESVVIAAGWTLPFVARGFYVDLPFRCASSGRDEVWRAAQQRWW